MPAPSVKRSMRKGGRRTHRSEGARPEPPTIVLAFHKPKGLVTTHHDEHGRETVYDRLCKILPKHLARIEWHAVGRLDMDTTGLLLFTNDGALIHHVTQPATKLMKTYRVLAKGLLDEKIVRELESGVEMSGGLGISGAAKITIEEHQRATTWLTIQIHEGKNRQVRRMFLAVGSQVIRLQRIAIGDVQLDVEENGWRQLSDEEIRTQLHFLRV